MSDSRKREVTLLTRAQRIDVLKRLLPLYTTRFAELRIGKPGEPHPMTLAPAAVKGLVTDRIVALAFVVPREGMGGGLHPDIRSFAFQAASYDADDAIWTLHSRSGLELAVEEATAASGAADALARLKADPDVVADCRVALRRRIAEEGREVTP